MPTEDKDKETEQGAVVEKRVKSTVIRRRSASSAAKIAKKQADVIEAESKEKAAEEAKTKPKKTAAAAAPKKAAATSKKKAAATEEKEQQLVEAVSPETSPEPSKKTTAAAKKSEAAPEEVLSREPVAEKPKAAKETEAKPATQAAAPEAKAAKADEKPQAGKRPAAKEVKVFGKEPPAKKFFPQRVQGKKGRRFRNREPHRRRHQVVQNRALKSTEITVPTGASRVVRIVDAISIAELSQRLGVKAGEIIKKLMALGIMATVNQFIDLDAATLIAQEYDFEVENAAVQEETLLESAIGSDASGAVITRPPVVTVMGHVDHGKTSLLDAIRETNVATGEAGGITQHIGAYHVHLDKGDVTFLDTPGHEAFTTMRSRGAKVTDLVILVVAADDGVMPQTVEAINHAKAAGVPIIVAINKMDLPDADSTRVRNELSSYELISEEWGGDTIFMEVSAKVGTNVKELVEMILLQAEILELKASVETPARGVIVEAQLDKGRGPVATVLIQSGTVKVGDAFVSGVHHGRARAMLSDRGQRIESAGPSMPIEVIGLSGVPEAGDTFHVVKDESTARQIAAIRAQKIADKELTQTAKISLEDLYEQISKGDVKELNLIVKADVHGSIEAVKDSLNKLSTDAVKLKFIHSAVGGINEGDVMLASASNAIIIGFNVRPETKAYALAKKDSVDVKLYNVIYNLVDDVRNAMEGLLAPIIREEVLGRAEVRDIFRVTKVGTVAGCYIVDGKASRNAKVRLVRDNVVIYEGILSSLKRFKEDVKEVQTGYECGMAIDGYNDLKVGDVIELYVEKEEMAKL
jgi:translation initiation factor IF-2